MIDFTDKNKQVELNEARLKEEYKRRVEIRSRIGILSVCYSIFAVYTAPLIKFAYTTALPQSDWFYILTLIIFLFFFVSSISYAIGLLMPEKTAFMETPYTFYNKTYNDYQRRDIKKELIKYYIRDTYLKQIEKAVEQNYRLNNKKRRFYYYAFILTFCAIIPYFTCVGIKITKEPDEVQKVELINSYFYSSGDAIKKQKTIGDYYAR
ncbi:MAG: hypothetical protein JRJ44_03045 [Deltaproteobacteria bacterium]|nr:hypothetical protein [Deltaproteobacteria bacterium]